MHVLVAPNVRAAYLHSRFAIVTFDKHAGVSRINFTIPLMDSDTDRCHSRHVRSSKRHTILRAFVPLFAPIRVVRDEHSVYRYLYRLRSHPLPSAKLWSPGSLSKICLARMTDSRTLLPPSKLLWRRASDDGITLVTGFPVCKQQASKAQSVLLVN